MQTWTQGGLKQSFAKCLWSSQLKQLTFKKFRFVFFLMLVPCSLGVFPCCHEALTYLNPLLFVLDLVPIIWANIRFLGDVAFDFTLVAWMAFVLHTFHHLHDALASVWNVHLTIDNLSKPRFQSTQEGQLSSKLLLKGDNN
jgi:hypothetical protein